MKPDDLLNFKLDDAEKAKLEIDRKTNEFEALIEEARAMYVKDFKTFEDFEALKGEYALGSYNYAFKHSGAYFLSKLPNVALMT